jgi:hypothetical protein
MITLRRDWLVWVAPSVVGVGRLLGGGVSDNEIQELRRRLTDKTRECTDLQRRLDAAATAIAALHHDNTLLRQELGQHHGNVVPLCDHVGVPQEPEESGEFS